LTKKNIHFLFLLHLAAGTVSAQLPALDYASIENELKAGAANHVEFKQVSDTPIVYRAWGVWNFRHSAQEVAAVALDFDHYTTIFRYVYRCDRITSKVRSVSPLGTLYVEGRAAIARVWAIGNIDTLAWSDSLHLRFIAHQNEDHKLESAWSYQEPGWLNYRTHGVRLAAFVVGSGPDSCRVGIMAQGWVKSPMPVWLVSMATGIILPQLLQDIEKEVVRRAEERKPKEPPWYSKWYKAVEGWFF
jgi:hypothetical protein